MNGAKLLQPVIEFDKQTRFAYGRDNVQGTEVGS